MKRLLIITFILLLCGPTFAETYTIKRVIDGVTLKLTNGETVRLMGIDTPESKPNKKAQRDADRTGQDLDTITKMGQEATEFLKKSFGHTKVRLEYDVQKKDKYSRTLAYAYSLLCLGECKVDDVGDVYVQLDDGLYVFINASMVKQGYATPLVPSEVEGMTIPPNVKYVDLFKELYQEAKENKRGLWAEPKSEFDTFLNPKEAPKKKGKLSEMLDGGVINLKTSF